MTNKAFETTVLLPQPVTEVFRFLCGVANRVTLAPAELQLRLVEGPNCLQQGSRLVVEGRRMGLVLRMVSEITALEEGLLIVEEQRQGPLPFYKHTQRFSPRTDGGTRLVDVIEYQPPGGMLGLVLTSQTIEAELQASFAQRDQRLPNLLAK